MTIQAGAQQTHVTLQPYDPAANNNNNNYNNNQQPNRNVAVQEALVSNAPIQYAIPDVEVETWLGIPLRNKRKDRLIKIVITLAFVAAMIELIDFVISVEEGETNTMQLVVNLVIALSIPYCGYKGARSDDNAMIWWFCGCNFMEAIWSSLILMYIDMHEKTVRLDCAECGSLNDFDYSRISALKSEDPEKYSDTELCLQTLSDSTNFDITYCDPEYVAKLARIKKELFATLLPLLVLYTVTAYYGNLLYREDGKVEIQFPDESSSSSTAGDHSITAQISLSNSFVQPGVLTGNSTLQPGNPTSCQSRTGIEMTNFQQSSNPGLNYHVATIPKNYDPHGTYAELPFAGEAMAFDVGSNHGNNYNATANPVFTTVLGYDGGMASSQQQRMEEGGQSVPNSGNNGES